MSDTIKSIKPYDKMPEFIESVFNVFQLANQKATKQNDKRFKLIALTIYNYVRNLAKENNTTLNNIKEQDSINLIPIFEYISHNNIELYDFTKINVEDVDVSKKEDLEKFVLTHIYYITQSNI
jgi:UV DNA damage repair endonuclease